MAVAPRANSGPHFAAHMCQFGKKTLDSSLVYDIIVVAAAAAPAAPAAAPPAAPPAAAPPPIPPPPPPLAAAADDSSSSLPPHGPQPSAATGTVFICTDFQ